MTDITFIYDFNRSKRLEKAIYLSIYFARTFRKLISTKISVLPEQWDNKSEKIMEQDKEKTKNINLTLNGANIRQWFHQKQQKFLYSIGINIDNSKRNKGMKM